jgi:hypothetical protein
MLMLAGGGLSERSVDGLDLRRSTSEHLQAYVWRWREVVGNSYARIFRTPPGRFAWSMPVVLQQYLGAE